MGDSSADTAARVKGLTLVKPIVYGNVAKYFGKKREEDGHTHQWTVYVKPFDAEDMSVWVKKVHFKLHESYPNQNRVVTKPPFEVQETGWGEFEVVIKIHLQDPNERPVTLYHILKLFETDPVNKTINVKKNIVSEFYDEIVFHEPSLLLQQLLTSPVYLPPQTHRHESNFEDKADKTLAAIMAAKNKVRHEITDLRERLRVAQDMIVKYKQEIARADAEQAPPAALA